MYTFNSNTFLLLRFMQALSYIIPNLPLHQLQQAHWAWISLTACLLCPPLQRLACLQAQLCTVTLCPCISFQYRSFTPGSKELPSYLWEDYQKPLRDLSSFPAINKLVLLAGERQEVTHTFWITQMQNSWDSSRLKSQEMGAEASHNINLPASLHILHAFLNRLSRKEIKE